MSLAWYVLHSKPNKESFLFAQLRHRDIEAFYPRLQVEPVNPRSRKVRPFFPGYLFVHVDLDETPLSSLAWVPGVRRLVSFDDEPAIVPEEVITGIRKNVQRINQAQADKKKQGLKHGDPVTILDGPFEGYQAIFDTALEGSERVRLLIKFIRDKQIRVQVPADMAKPQKS